MNAFQNGAVIAIAAGSLFAAACKKEEPKATDKPVATETKPAETKPAETKPAEAKPAVAPVNAEKPVAATVEKTDKVHCGGVNGTSRPFGPSSHGVTDRRPPSWSVAGAPRLVSSGGASVAGAGRTSCGRCGIVRASASATCAAALVTDVQRTA